MIERLRGSLTYANVVATGAVFLALAAGFWLFLVSTADAGTPGPTTSLGRAGGLEYVTADHADVVSPAGAPADCDVGQDVLGGGGSVSGEPDEARLLSSYPTNLEGGGWTATGARLAGSDSITVTTFAVCGAVTNTYRQDSFSAPANSSSGDVMECPVGVGRLTGAGVRIDSADVRLYDSFPATAKNWHLGVWNDSDADPLPTGYSVCNDELDLRYREGENIAIPPGETKRAIARCGRRQVVTAGGYDSDGVSPVVNRPRDSGDRRSVPDDGWLVRLHNPQGVSTTATPFAVCKV